MLKIPKGPSQFLNKKIKKQFKINNSGIKNKKIDTHILNLF